MKVEGYLSRYKHTFSISVVLQLQLGTHMVVPESQDLFH
jgi:hypothetical protein